MANVSAEASATVDWLGSASTIAIPVYQREYRWRQATCEQLLADIRRIADAPDGRTHFIGSILATREESGGITLVDGQQRVTTLLLMLAAIRAHAAGKDEAITRAIDGVTLAPGAPDQPRLRPHERYHDVVRDLLTGASDGTGSTTFEANYFYFRDRLESDWTVVWRGIQRLEHVTISLGRNAGAQQIFESLNSTGAALSDDELIHNYVHMGRSRDEQVELERDTWIPIEEATAGATRAFWRDYLVLTSDTQLDFSGDFGVYRAFRQRIPDARAGITSEVRTEWVRQADRYGVLLHPAREDDLEIAEQLNLLRAFEGAPRPLALGVYGDYRDGRIGKRTLVATLEQIQAMLIRRALVGLARDIGVIGTVCRELRAEGEYPIPGLLRRTPEDPAVRLALTHSSLPLAGYVLRRIQRPPTPHDLQIEHIYPQVPRPEWTGGGARWGDLSVDEQARYRALLNTIGNLTLLEGPLNAGASNRSYREKAENYFARSVVEETRAFKDQHEIWDAAGIQLRTQTLIERFLEIWPRPSGMPMDAPEDLTRVVDLAIPYSNMADPDRFEYAVFRGQVWGDVHNVKTMHWRVAEALYAMDPARLRASQHGGHITATKKPNIRYAPQQFPDGRFLYAGWATKWLWDVVQGWITSFELDDEVHVKVAEMAQPMEPSDPLDAGADEQDATEEGPRWR